MSDEKDSYQCQECGLHYESEELAKACYEFCSTYKACNIEISLQSIEHKRWLAK